MDIKIALNIKVTSCVYVCVYFHPGSSGYKLSFSDAGAGEHSLVVRAYVNGQLAGSGTATFTVPSKCQPFFF